MILAGISLFATACGWTQAGYDAGRSFFNPVESSLTPENVARLGVSWTGTMPGTSADLAPLMSGSSVYTMSRESQIRIVAAFDADGGATCSGSPRTCAPRWTATVPGPEGGFVLTNGLVLVGGSAGGVFEVLGYSADGTDGCAGQPRTCSPIWMAKWGSIGSGVTAFELAVADGKLFAATTHETAASTRVSTTFAFDLSAECSVSTPCTPVFRTRPDVGSAGGVPIAVDQGYLFQNYGAQQVGAFDASGQRGCQGSPMVCDPVRLYPGLTPTAAGGVLYLRSPATGGFDAFRVNRLDRCNGDPLVCAPDWTMAGQTSVPPAVGNGLVYLHRGALDDLASYDGSGLSGCTGMPLACSGTTIGAGVAAVGGVAVTRSLLVATALVGPANTHDLLVLPSSPCSADGQPCAPLATVATPFSLSAPVISGGRIAATASNNTLYVFAVPT